MYNVSDFVDIVENKLDGDVSDYISMCKRVNNKKRDYLFVNKLQGKHVACNPSKILNMLDMLVDEVDKVLEKYKEDKILVVGFAETATAIGEHLATRLSEKYDISGYVHTTREKFSDVAEIISFNEEHSHAVEQKLYFAGKVPKFDRVLFVEDEITTGKTILNFISEFDKKFYSSYTVASILNWQNEESVNKYKDIGVSTAYLVKGVIKENPPIMDIKSGSLAEYDSDVIYVTDFTDARKGILPSDLEKGYESLVENMYKKLGNMFSLMNRDILVVGTEEYMYIPLCFSVYLEDINLSVEYLATTRSPITVSTKKGYLFNDGLCLSSAYDKDRKTYFYGNTEKNIDIVVFITDAISPMDSFSGMKKWCDAQGIKSCIINVRKEV